MFRRVPKAHKDSNSIKGKKGDKSKWVCICCHQLLNIFNYQHFDGHRSCSFSTLPIFCFEECEHHVLQLTIVTEKPQTLCGILARHRTYIL
jgi:hypothetical protein